MFQPLVTKIEAGTKVASFVLQEDICQQIRNGPAIVMAIAGIHKRKVSCALKERKNRRRFQNCSLTVN